MPIAFTDEILPPLPETLAMKNLSKSERDRLIDESSNVADLRPKLAFAKRQRDLAASYRKGGPEKGPGPTRA